MRKRRGNSIHRLVLVLTAVAVSFVPLSVASAARILPTPDGATAVAEVTPAGDAGETLISPIHNAISPSVAGTGVIDGTVTYLGVPVTTGCAYLLDATFAEAGSDCVDGSGYFSISGLAAGDYYVQVRGVTGAADTWYGNVRLYTQSTPVAVTESATSTANIAMVGQGGTVSGKLTVTGAATDLSGSYAQVYTDNRIYVAEVLMDAAGNFTIPGVAAGTYRVRFVNLPGMNSFWWGYGGEIVPGTVVVGPAGSWAVTGVTVTVGSTERQTTLSGVLNVPIAWTSPTVCVAAIDMNDFFFDSAYCGARGEVFNLDRLVAGVGYQLVFTNAELSTDQEFWDWHVGGYTERWFGNTTNRYDSPYFLLDPGEWWVAVYFFEDVDSTSPFFVEISWMADLGVTTGYSDGTFRPSANVSRQAMAAFMYRFAGEPAYTPPGTSPFNDVPTSSPFYTEICWMADTGITTGYPDGGFHPTANVSRQAMAAFMYRFAGYPAFVPPSSSPFVDLPMSSPFYLEVTWMAATGISTGYGDGGFHPPANVSRQAMAAFMYRLDAVLSIP